jgi:CHAT domain
MAAAREGAPGAGETPISAASALTEAAGGLRPGHVLRPAVLETLRETLSRQVQAARSSDDIAARLAEIADAMDRMPPGDPASAHTMTMIGMEMLSASTVNRSVLQDERLVSRFERLGSGLDPDDPIRPLARYMQCSFRLARAISKHRLQDADTLIEELARCADSVPAGYIARPYMLAGLAIAYVDRHGMGGELRHLQQAETFIKRAFDEAGPDGPFSDRGAYHGLLLYLRGHLQVVRSYYDASPERVTAAISDLEHAAAASPGLEKLISAGIIAALGPARVLRERLLAPAEQPMTLGAEERQSFDLVLEVANRTGRQGREYPVLASQAAAGLMLRGMADSDISLIDRAIRMLAEAANGEGLAARERSRLLEAHGFALLTRYSRTQVPADLASAIDRLEEARRAVEQELGSPRAASILQSLASAYRMRGNAARGDVDRAVTLGLAALREHAGDVFLQDSDDNALRIARVGISDATEMARWFLTHGREQAAVGAVELGRGMVLHAATSGAAVQQVLREAGHTDLADEWARRSGQPAEADAGPTDDLRYRVMLAIEQSPAESRLLSAPAVGEVAAALTATGSDALAYLLPRGDDGQGLAIIVDWHGTVRRLPLPGLYLGGGSVAGAFLRARPPVETVSGTSVDPARMAWLDALSDLCGWAWGVAIGPLLRAVPARGAAAERRIVLVPAGELGLVPWHAAREPHSGRYACQHAMFTYAASARQFVETTRCGPRSWAQAPVLISDAGDSEYLTAVGVAYLHAAHYSAGSVFGFAREKLAGPAPGAAAASPDDVLAALPRVGSPGASLLHFGCHGRARVPALGSMLTLGKDAHGEEINVEVRHILRQARAGQAGAGATRSSGGLVVLASCLTDLTERDFDEALTLATAFLSAGATGVVAARWEVEAKVTALFMNVFHGYLNGPFPQPARALREAQVWMLNPDREIPREWPKALRDEADLAGRPGGADLQAPRAWAGFIYQGQ